jgi:RNA polymerase sigma-70 factor (ECF subfamily)
MISPDARCAHRTLEAQLRPFVARRVSPADVDDVVQDVFLRMQRGLSALRDDDRFGPWVYQVARSAIADQRRMRARHPLADDQAPEAADEGVDEAEDTAIECDLAAYVAGLVATLPSPYREALTLTELEGQTQKAAAEMVGVSLSGMKSRVQRGRQMLRKLVEDCCEIALDARGRVIRCEARSCGPKS